MRYPRLHRTPSVRGVASLAPSMLTTKAVGELTKVSQLTGANSVMTSPSRPPFDFKAALIASLLSVSLCAPASLPCEWDSGLAPCAEACVCCALRLAQPAQPAVAEEGLPSISMPTVVRAKTFQEASVDVAMDAYPVVKSLKAGPVASLGTKVVSLAATGDPKEIIRTIDAGLDAFLSVPPGARDARHERTLGLTLNQRERGMTVACVLADRFLKTVVALKEATAVASSAPTCNLVCMPPPPYVEKVAHWAQTSRATHAFLYLLRLPLRGPCLEYALSLHRWY